jgi:hypothetical protein
MNGDMAMGECEDRQRKSFHVFKQTINISKEDMEDYNLVMYTHVMDFFKEWTNF